MRTETYTEYDSGQINHNVTYITTMTNNLAWNGHEVIAWVNGEPDHRRICASPGVNVLNNEHDSNGATTPKPFHRD